MNRSLSKVSLAVGLVFCLALTGAAVADPLGGWTPFVIRNSDTSGTPPTLNTFPAPDNTVEFVVFEGGQKAALGTNAVNGSMVQEIMTLHIDRLDDVGTSGSLYGPYFNIWVTDGLGHYAVIANEPSNPEWAADRWYAASWDDLKVKTCKVYETPGASAGTSWVHTHAGLSTGLTFEDVGDLMIMPPSPAYIADPLNAVGSGAPDELGTNVAYGYNWIFGDTLANYVSGDPGFLVGNYYIYDAYPVQNTTQLTGYMTIEAALAAANPYDTITVANGPYSPVGTLNVTVPLTLTGESESGVAIQIPAAGGYGFSVGADAVTLQNFTLVCDAANLNYPIHASGTGNPPGGFTGLTMTDVTVIGAHKRAGVDIHGYNDIVLSQVSSFDAWGGNGIQLTGVVGADLDNITTGDNAWGSIAIYCSSPTYLNRGSSDVVIDGATLNAGEDYVFSQDEFGLFNGTYSITGYEYNVRNSRFREAGGYTDSEGYTFLRDDLADAAAFALAFTGYELFSTILEIATGDYFVADGMSVQAAVTEADPGSTIHVGPGTYVEAILIEKDLTVLGATAGVNKNGYTVPAGYAWDPMVESIISHPDPVTGYDAIVDIHDTDNVTFDGFVVEELNAVANKNVSLVRVYAHTREITNIDVVNCIIGPNTNTTMQDGAQGRMGLYIINHPYNDLGVVNSTFAGNKIFDCQGNGDNVFLWTSYYSYGAPGPADMTGTVIEDNEIYGSHRSGIETAGGFANLVIRNNTIYGQTGLPGDDPDFLKYGHGIQLIRGSSDKVSDPLTAYGPVDLLIEGNEIFGNQKCGIYMGPKNENVQFVGNVIHDNGWDGIMLDLEGNYWNPQYESPPVSGDYACYDCSEDISASGNEIYGNGTLGNPIAQHGFQVVGVPTNGLLVAAEDNWWGDSTGPLDTSDDTGTGGLYNPGGLGDEVTDHIDYYPWSGLAGVAVVPATSGPLTCGLTQTLTFRLTTDEYTPDVFGFNAVVRATGEVNWGTITSLAPFGGTTQFYSFDMGGGVYTISGTTVGNPTQPISGAGTTDLFKIDFVTASDGTAQITFDSFTLRDPANQSIPATATGATIEVDCTAPAAVTGITAAPGHEKVDVSWTHDGTDVAFYEVYRGLWYDTTTGVSAYPEYDDLAGDVIPTRPASRAAADLSDEWVLVDTVAVGTNSLVDDGMASGRGVYYYEVFPVDAASNWGPAAAANDRATNYWLGDVTGIPGLGYTTPDGDVDPVDMNALGAQFGNTVALGGLHNVLDVGPTDDWSRVGIPLTDSVINFEDLMVFAMNFGVVGPAKDQAPISATVQLAWVHYDNGTMALRLIDGSGLKGVNVMARAAVSGVRSGVLLDEQAEQTFLKNIGSELDVSVALLGTGKGFIGSGDLFTVSAESAIAFEDLAIKARGTDNRELKVELVEATDTATPRVFSLNANYPNPFNPMTKISFSLPEAQSVRLMVYGVDGRLIKTLLNERRGAGQHEVVWMGRDDADQQVASGVYFYRLDAGPYSQVRKMTLMK
ncbi:right-handed parallel beta-helix repeat-containing protein [bacterium]|nr:right-handed parallel beta-helix repeat-containing protein [bacterium]